MFRQAPAMPYHAKIGQVEMFSGTTPPEAWMICDGSVINRSTYADLFGVLGTAYGGGDGESTFAIPDFQGRAPVGAGESSATGHTAHTLGQYDGEETHTLTVAELAYHTHGYIDYWTVSRTSKDVTCVSWSAQAGSSGGTITRGTGSGTPHNVMQPYTGINFIIYTGVEQAS